MSNVCKLNEYRILNYFVVKVDLEINLQLSPIQTKAILTIEKNTLADIQNSELKLHCENIDIISIQVNQHTLTATDFNLDNTHINIHNPPNFSRFTVEIISRLKTNTDLFGLYETEGVILVKAETEGLRRVFPCIDRPDNLALYNTTIIAAKDKFPVLLSNGNLTNTKNLNQGIHSVTWDDPIPKPSYLFALVAGNLKCARKLHTSQSGKETFIHFYLPEHTLDKCNFASTALQNAMNWDEQRFGLECPLSEYKIAGVDKYASGASEPLGLNLFNTSNLLASEESRTDSDIIKVIDVVAHEYFHTWTGDLVTIRDWFNLSLKEGLTTFRTNLFLEDYYGLSLNRMLSKNALVSEAPRPENYSQVRSLYNSAAYEKSAELFRMIMKSIGELQFNKILHSCLHHYRGHAITLENVLEYFSDKAQMNLQSYIHWFTQNNIPIVNIIAHYDDRLKKYTLEARVTHLNNRPIPIELGLLNNQGIPLISSMTWIINKEYESCEFENINQAPTPSLLRGFSAPVILQFDYSDTQLLQLMQYDDDPYNRCQSASLLYTRIIRNYCQGLLDYDYKELFKCLRCIIKMTKDFWLTGELIRLPPLESLIIELSNFDLKQIATSRRALQYHLAKELKNDFLALISTIKIQYSQPQMSFDVKNAAKRQLKTLCYSYLIVLDPEETKSKLVKNFHSNLGKNMSETISALNLLINTEYKQSNRLLDIFFRYWEHDQEAINYWFNIQASMHSTRVITTVTKLTSHPAFDYSNPNKVFALFRAFIKNPYGFHCPSGRGYSVLAHIIIKIEKINPTLAIQLLSAFNIQNHPISNKLQKIMIANQLKLIQIDSHSLEVKETISKLLAIN